MVIKMNYTIQKFKRNHNYMLCQTIDSFSIYDTDINGRIELHWDIYMDIYTNVNNANLCKIYFRVRNVKNTPVTYYVIDDIDFTQPIDSYNLYLILDNKYKNGKYNKYIKSFIHEYITKYYNADIVKNLSYNYYGV